MKPYLALPLIAFSFCFGDTHELRQASENPKPLGGIMLASEICKSSQVICTCSKIKDGHLEDVRGWFKKLQDRKDETLESFRNEGVWLESAFLQEQDGQYYLIYYMRAEDIDRAMAVFQASSLEIDWFHKQCWEQFTEQHEVLSPMFHLENPDIGGL